MNLDVVVQSENEAIEEVSVPYLLKGMLLGILIILSLMTVTYAWIARQANFIALALYQFFMTLFAGKTLGISLASILIDGAWWRGSGVFINLTICLASLGWFWSYILTVNKRIKASTALQLKLASIVLFLILPVHLIVSQSYNFEIAM